MLVKLFPEQVGEYWNFLMPAIRDSLPPTADPDSMMSNVLEGLLQGLLHCWIVTNENCDIKAVCTTTFSFDVGTGTKNLIIYSLYWFTQLGKNEILEGIEILSTFAQANNCKRVCAYSCSPQVIKAAKMLNGNVNYRYITFEV